MFVCDWFRVMLTVVRFGVIVLNVCVIFCLVMRGGRNQALGFGLSVSVSGCLIAVVLTRYDISLAPQDVREMLGITSKPSLSGRSPPSSSRMFSTWAFACLAYFCGFY